MAKSYQFSEHIVLQDTYGAVINKIISKYREKEPYLRTDATRRHTEQLIALFRDLKEELYDHDWSAVDQTLGEMNEVSQQSIADANNNPIVTHAVSKSIEMRKKLQSDIENGYVTPDELMSALRQQLNILTSEVNQFKKQQLQQRQQQQP